MRKTAPSKSLQKFLTLIQSSPSPRLAENNLSALLAAGNGIDKLPPGELKALITLLGSSAFLSEVLINHGKNWPDLFMRQIKIPQKTFAHHVDELNIAVKDSATFDEFCAALRHYKQRDDLRIRTRE